MCHMSYVTCHVSRVTCHMSLVTNDSGHSHRQSPSNSPINHSRLIHSRVAPKTWKRWKTQKISKTERNPKLCHHSKKLAIRPLTRTFFYLRKCFFSLSQTDRLTDIANNRLNRPKGQFCELKKKISCDTWHVSRYVWNLTLDMWPWTSVMWWGVNSL